MRDPTGPHSRPPTSAAALNDLELRVRALERLSERSTGSVAVIKWLVGAVLGVSITAAVGVWRTVAVSETRLDHLTAQAIADRQDVVALDTRLDDVASLRARLARVEERSSELARDIASHRAQRRHGP